MESFIAVSCLHRKGNIVKQNEASVLLHFLMHNMSYGFHRQTPVEMVALEKPAILVLLPGIKGCVHQDRKRVK